MYLLQIVLLQVAITDIQLRALHGGLTDVEEDRPTHPKMMQAFSASGINSPRKWPGKNYFHYIILKCYLY